MRWMDANEFLERVSNWEMEQDREIKRRDEFRRLMES